MKILLTGFQPFGGQSTNVTQLLLENLTINHPSIQLETAILPTTFQSSFATYMDHFHQFLPHVVIHFGEHAKTDAITLERIAINMDDARIKDNDGKQPKDKTIIKNGDNAFFATLPLRAIEQSLKLANIPVKLSYSAGTFVCNHLFYLSMHELSKTKNQIMTGFIHLPLIKEQKPQSPFDLSMLKRAVNLIIKTCYDQYKT